MRDIFSVWVLLIKIMKKVGIRILTIMLSFAVIMLITRRERTRLIK